MSTSNIVWRVSIVSWNKFICQTCAITRTLINVPVKMIARCPITELRACTIPRSTSQSIARNILKTCLSVSMVIIAHLLIVQRSWKPDLFIRWPKTQISTCSTSKLNGVPLTRNTIRLSACTPTIGKISDASRIFSSIRRTQSVKTGSQELSLPNITRDVLSKRAVWIVTVGRSKNIIQCSTRPWSARNSETLQALPSIVKEESSARTITLKKTGESHLKLIKRETGKISIMIKF